MASWVNSILLLAKMWYNEMTHEALVHEKKNVFDT